MKAKEIKDGVFGILAREKGIKVYFVLKKEDKRIVKNVNIVDELEECDNTTQDLLKGCCDALESLFSEYDDTEDILKLSSADERKNGLYYYDLDDEPLELELMRKTIANGKVIEQFDFKTDSLEEIAALIMVVGDAEQQIVVYKQQYPISLLRRDKCMLMPIPHRNRLKRVQDDILRVDFNFQMCLVKGKVLVLDIDKMEKLCSFHTLLVNEAKKSIDLISNLGILDNVQSLEDELDNIRFVRKLTRIYKDSKVLGKVSNDRIILFAQKHKYFVNNPLKIVGDKIVLDTKRSKDTFVKLMNDDFLVSELTSEEYESLAKNGV